VRTEDRGQRTEDRGQRTEDRGQQMSGIIESYRELKVYKMAFELQQEIFELSKSFPVEEKYSLTDQVRRSSRSVGANIAESWQKRRYTAHFCNKLTDSDGENAETEHWIETAFACKYISDQGRNRLLSLCEQIGRMLGTMILHPEKFCKEAK